MSTYSLWVISMRKVHDSDGRDALLICCIKIAADFEMAVTTPRRMITFYSAPVPTRTLLLSICLEPPKPGKARKGSRRGGDRLISTSQESWKPVAWLSPAPTECWEDRRSEEEGRFARMPHSAARLLGHSIRPGRLTPNITSSRL